MVDTNWRRLLRRAVLGKEGLADPDWPVDHVPRSERRDLLSISAVLLGFVFFAGTMWSGAEVGAALGMERTFTVMAVGYAILGVYVATLCLVAARAGLTTVLLARYTFGSAGAKWADLLLGGTQVGWFGVTIPMVAGPTAAYLGVTDPTLVAAITLLWGVLHLSSAYVGYEGMEKLSFVAVPVLFVVGVVSIWLAAGDVGGLDALVHVAGEPGTTMTFGAAVTVVVGTFVSGGTQAPNWARFAQNSRVAFWAGLVAFLFGNGFLFVSGAVGGAVYDVTPAGDLYAVLAAQGLATVGLVALILNIWTTNDNSAYAFGVAGSEAFGYDRKRPFVLAGGVVGIALALLGASGLLVPWLNVLGTYVPPLGGVVIADFLVRWRLRVPRMDDVSFAVLRPVPVAAYVLGCLGAVLTAGSVVPGVAAPSLLPGIPALNGIVVAIVAHLLGHYALERTGIATTHDVAPDATYTHE
ncbi:cytosine permease [Halarchaeum rubridurum]|uniref:Cytosine permease n=1 Tax=Halarchaeum rubridurum TaxID=489911 RepID=A0A830G4Q7_9EURY|nr:cytosine permease [Halarchaeum rubridurum]MBP1955980.1 cytosine permease [Halarchaeum rubridurum]GGM76248.1 purine-cytosine permease [Halarchaeum rubridurum]